MSLLRTLKNHDIRLSLLLCQSPDASAEDLEDGKVQNARGRRKRGSHAGAGGRTSPGGEQTVLQASV